MAKLMWNAAAIGKKDRAKKSARNWTKLSPNLPWKKKATVNHNVPKKLRLGDSVKILSMNLKGTVHTLPDAKGNLFVQAGILRYQTNIRDLVLLNEDATPVVQNTKTGAGKLKNGKIIIRFSRNQPDR